MSEALTDPGIIPVTLVCGRVVVIQTGNLRVSCDRYEMPLHSLLLSELAGCQTQLHLQGRANEWMEAFRTPCICLRCAFTRSAQHVFLRARRRLLRREQENGRLPQATAHNASATLAQTRASDRLRGPADYDAPEATGAVDATLASFRPGPFLLREKPPR